MANSLTIENQLQQKNDDYYNLYQKLKQWAIDQWTGPNDVPEQIRHDVSHSEALMEYANTILQSKLKSDYLNEKELFLFASAVFLHDIGMQYGWKEHLGIQGDRGNLAPEERKQIRVNHAKTSGDVIRSFKNALPRSLDENLSSKQKNIFNDLSERLGFIAESHNQKGIAEHLKHLPVLFQENKLKIDFLAALLQFCDTMHMDKSRLNENRFLDELGKWETGKPLEAAYEPRDWQRFFQSYFVESVKLVSVNESDVFEIQVEIRFNPKENEAFRDRFLNIYRRRLERRKHDCLEVLRNHEIRFTGDDPFKHLEPESTKILLPQCFIDVFGQLEADIKIAESNASTKKTLPNSKTAEPLDDYHSWRCATTATYVIPGIKNTAMPIDRCWLPLSTIELPLDTPPPQSPREELDLYMKTGKGKTGQENKYDAEWMGVGLRRMAIVGGPGSGKSLLLRRIAHREAKAGSTVLLAKLKYVASEMNRKKVLFEEALTSVALTGFNCNEPQKKAIIQAATLLLLDGLDECGGQRQAIAAEIVAWSASHPETTIIITTRPVGHAPATLPQWTHYSLNTDDIYAYRFSEFALDGVCNEVFKDRQELIKQVEKRLQRVIHSDGWRGKDKDYKTVRNVPLLFSFVISLAVNGFDIPSQRMALYRDVIKLLAGDDVQDRGTETTVGASEAYLFLHYLAWLLMKDPVIDYDTLMKKSGEMFAAEFELKSAAARQAAERAFSFWEERRLLERLHHGTGDLVTFMHLGFCEYAAAKHLETISQEEIKRWVVSTRGDARWKEVYLNAASLGLGQVIVETLLELDHPTPPDSNEAIFAAELAAIAENIDEIVLQKLLQHIMHRLTFGYPRRACDAAESLLPLARKYSHLIGSHLKPLLTHEDEWTRFAALALCLESGKEFVDLQELKEKYPDILPQSRFPSLSRTASGKFCLSDLCEPHDLKMAIVSGATKILLAEGVNSDLLDRIKRMYEKELSVYQTSELSDLFKENGNSELIAIAAEHSKKYFEQFQIPTPEVDKDELGFLDLLLTACTINVDGLSADVERPFIHLAKLVHVLRMGEMTYSWSEWLSSGKEQQALLVIRGAIRAAGVEPLELCRDIVAARKKLENDKYNSLFLLIPSFPMTDDWSKSSELSVDDPELLASAITHPCKAVALAAAEIIYEGAINEQLKTALTNVLIRSRFRSLYFISLIADRIWGDNVLEIVLSRLEQELTSGCNYLIKRLPDYSSGRCNDRIFEVIKRALVAESEDVAEAAAELCLEFVSNDQLLSELKSALCHWKKHEKPYPKSGGVIPPSPRPSLMKAIIQRNGFSFDELVELYEDARSDVKDLAQKALLRLAMEAPEVVSRMLDLIESGRFGSTTLWSLMELPFAPLQHEHNRLLKLLNSDNPDIQIVMLAAIKRHPLYSEADSVHLLQHKLESTNIAIREAAIRALRQYE